MNYVDNGELMVMVVVDKGETSAVTSESVRRPTTSRQSTRTSAERSDDVCDTTFSDIGHSSDSSESTAR